MDRKSILFIINDRIFFSEITKLLRLDLNLNEFVTILRQNGEQTYFMVIPEINATHAKGIPMK